jgi:ABC-type transport system involved in multi-copper enzyme maturation permease subunit
MMFVNAFRMEWTKVFRRRMTWVLVGILALLVAGMYLVLYAASQAALSDPGASPGTVEELRGMLCWPQAFSMLLGFTGGMGLGGIMLVILAGAVTAQEYSWRTAHLWLSRGLPRSAFLLGKYAVLLVAALLVILTALLVGMVLTGWFTQQLNGSLSVAELNVVELALSILRTVYTLLPYLSLTFLVAILTRSTAAAIGVGLAYTLLVDEIAIQLLGMAGGIWAEMARYLPGSLAAALMQTNERLVKVDLSSGVNAGLPGPWAAAGGIALYAIAFLGLSLWAFRRQNLTG